ncbi:hypothetical protein HDU92_000792 [Lobulomyces angularis]|nr:hypothetical protein HDU92_000792 [Lobulomyces angularis]
MKKAEYFQDNLKGLLSNKVHIDPNKRDLLYCLGSNGNNSRYTQIQRRKESGLKSYQKIRQKFSNQVLFKHSSYGL